MPTPDDNLLWRGEWDEGVDYAELDAVYSGSTVYVCVLAHTSAENIAPPNATYWELAAPSSIGAAYFSAQEYRAAIGSSDGSKDSTIDRQAKAISRLIERETGQFFGKDALPTTRVFRAKWSDLLELDYEGNCPGLASTSGLAIKVDTDGDGVFSDETAWASTDYELQPLNADKGPEPRPWSAIVVPRWSSKSFIPGNLVQVTGVFGWPSLPEPIFAMAIELLGIWRTENPRATGRLNELDEVVAASPMALSLVKRMREAYQGSVAL